MSWPKEYPLAYHEMSILLPHFLNEGRGKLDTYFSRVYNPIWTNPDGFSWMEALLDETQGRVPRRPHADLVGDVVVRRLRAADGRRIRTPRRGELRDALRSLDRLPPAGDAPLRRTQGRRHRRRAPHPRVQQGRGVGGERVLDRPLVADRPGRLARHPPVLRERRDDQARRWASTSTTPACSTRVPGLADDAAAAGQSPARVHARPRRLRRRPATCTSRTRRPSPPRTSPTASSDDGGVFRKPGTDGAWDGSDETLDGLTLAKLGDGSPAVEVDGEIKEGFPTPSKKLELFSTTLKDWGWPEHATPGWIPSHVHWEDLDMAGNERILLPTFRIPTLIHTRSGNSKWLNEISHRHPLWIHPTDAEQLGIEETGLVRITHPDRALRDLRLAHRGHPARRRRRDPPHGPLARSKRTPPARGATARPRSTTTGTQLEAHPRARQPALRLRHQGRRRRPRHPTDLVERHRRPPEPHLLRPTRPDLRHAVLAPAGPGHTAPRPTTSTATSSSTPPSHARPTSTGWPRPDPHPDPADSDGRCGTPDHSSPSPAPIVRRLRSAGKVDRRQNFCRESDGYREHLRAGSLPLDRPLWTQLWAQLEHELRRRMELGHFTDRFPTDRELMEVYGVSRHTARHAVSQLGADGILRRGPRDRHIGRSSHFERSLGSLYSLFQVVEESGVCRSAATSARLELVTDPEAAEQLGLDQLHRTRVDRPVRWAGDDPLAIDRIWLPADVAEPLLARRTSPTPRSTPSWRRTIGHASQRGLGTHPPGHSHRRGATGAPVSAAGEAVFSIERLGDLQRTDPVEWRVTTIRGDRFTLRRRLDRRPTQRTPHPTLRVTEGVDSPRYNRCDSGRRVTE